MTDLCAPDWHVCANASDVEANAPTGCTGATRAGDFPLFFTTRQSGTGNGVCATGTGRRPECNSSTGASGCQQTTRTSNDLFGCGNLGAAPARSCGALDRFSDNICAALGEPWVCGGYPAEYCETQAVQKPHPSRGGVLCCRKVKRVADGFTPATQRSSEQDGEVQARADGHPRGALRGEVSDLIDASPGSGEGPRP